MCVGDSVLDEISLLSEHLKTCSVEFPLYFLALKAEPWPPTNSPPPPPFFRLKPPHSIPPLLYILILACMKGLDCSRPEQWRITLELPSKCWVGYSWEGGLKKQWKSSHTCLPESKNNKKKKIGATLFYILFFYKCILCIYSQIAVKITCELWMYIAFTFLRLATAPL